ncbi:MAG: homoserine dehydrogenase [Vicinamibacterales bacterium]
MDVAMATVSSPGADRALGAGRGLRVIHVGVLGLGNVGQAVVRAAAASADVLRRRGLALSIDSALVRDVTKPRRCPRAGRLTSNVEAFMRGRFDVVIDALPGREPAAAIAGRLLGKGIPVVSANKVLIAADGRRLRRLAARAGTSLRIEAAVMAGVPFVGAFERRPLAAHVTRVAGILNGTSHFILSRIAAGAPFDVALAEAQALGYAEPNPDADVSGRDAREKLVVLADVLFGCAVRSASIVAEGIAGITPDALASAASLGGALKPIVFAARAAACAQEDGLPASSTAARALTAFAAPAWVPASHPLAAITGRDNAVVIDSRFSGRLVFAGPGAGPDVTAATLLDDAIEAAGDETKGESRIRTSHSVSVRAPETGWFVRITGERAPVKTAFVDLQIRAADLTVEKHRADSRGISLLISPAAADRVRAVRSALAAQGLTARVWRALHD